MPVTPSWCDGLSANNMPCTCVSYQGCAAGYPVTWCEYKAAHRSAQLRRDALDLLLAVLDRATVTVSISQPSPG